MTANPFATPSPNLAADSNGAPAPPTDDLDFSVDIPDMLPGLWDAHVIGVKKGTEGSAHEKKLLIEFMVDEGPKGQKVTFWCDPSDPQSMTNTGHVINALGLELVNRDGQNKPSCGWKGLVNKTCRVAVDVWQGKYQIPRFGKIKDDACPSAYVDRDFGCGVLAPGST